MAKITPFLWYARDAEEAARFYCGLIPNSRVMAVNALPAESPSGPAGSVKIVDFELDGQPFQAMTAGPLDPFNHAISLMIKCDNQAEIDRLYNGLQEGGGEPEPCGWLKDRYGVSWQIVPRVLEEMMRDKDPARAKRTAEAMLKMGKIDIAALRRAYEGA
jgi:predicted 3-demethylubiquinone-9 3-methyltransferase (glyoxalase superfamily)